MLAGRSCNLTFSFRKTNSNEVSKIIDNLDIKKASQNSDVLSKNIKLNKDIIAPFIYENFNCCIDKGEFSNDLKHADIFPVHKKKCKINKTSVRPVSTISKFSKLYEKPMYK